MPQFIKSILKKIIPPFAVEVSINECVHYGGFRYGGNDYNPYQTYTLELHDGIEKDKRQEKFIDFIKYYRPKNLGQALGITLENYVPLWIYPWIKYNKSVFMEKDRCWLDDPNDCPDIMTHFSAKGVLNFRLEEEFVWLERAYYLIKKNGYEPQKNNNYIELVRLIKTDNQVRYLVIDGNHRLSALGALNVKKARATFRSNVYEKNYLNWYCVRNNLISPKDALKIFNSYFERAKGHRTTDSAAKII
ncbi:MAG: hypothetical protein WC531_00070 [Candidatus Paceibacterota bacterium]|jgi:hypothetical protein